MTILINIGLFITLLSWPVIGTICFIHDWRREFDLDTRDLCACIFGGVFVGWAAVPVVFWTHIVLFLGRPFKLDLDKVILKQYEETEENTNDLPN